jgi:SnoaL-like polyketide cyclase
MRPILAMLALALCMSAQGQEKSAAVKDVALWYQAFDRNDPALLDRILSETWVEFPSAPGQPAGPDGAKQILAQLRTAFPDLTIKMQEVLQDGNKVIVRAIELPPPHGGVQCSDPHPRAGDAPRHLSGN